MKDLLKLANQEFNRKNYQKAKQYYSEYSDSKFNKADQEKQQALYMLIYLHLLDGNFEQGFLNYKLLGNPS